MDQTKQEIALLEKRWAQQEEKRKRQVIAENLSVRARTRKLLLENENFVVPCRCRKCLKGLLEMTEESCSGLNSYGSLFWNMAKQNV